MTHKNFEIESTDSTFRGDIQALRGVAVLLVVLYHAGMPMLSGGYLGVDVFFVISGFLITNIIRRGLEDQTFNFWQFYYRRAKRLLPAAYVVIGLTVLAGPFFLGSQAMDELGAQVHGALTFTVNFVFWQSAGYFDAAADTKALLHFWSLAIEEQYYLIMPFLLFLLPRRTWLAATIALMAISLTLALYIAPRSPDAAFYLLPARWWELALGSLGALLPIHFHGLRVLSIARLPAVFTLVAVPFFPSGMAHPGLDALIVCVSTLIIIIGHDNNRWETALPTRLFAWVGNLSYSLYLVHWPVLVFLEAAWLDHAPAHATVIAVVFSFLLSWLLFRFVEEPFRRGFSSARFSRSVAAGIFCVTLILAASPGLVASVTVTSEDYGYLRRTNYGLDRSCASGERFPFAGIEDQCRTNDDPRVILVGDSYAMAWTSGLAGPLRNVGLAQATMSACDPLYGMARFPRRAGTRYNQTTAQRCIEFHQAVLDHVRDDPAIEIVVLAARFQTILSTGNLMLVRTENGYEDREITLDLVASGVGSMVEEYRRAGKRVVVLAPPPANGMDIGECLERSASNRLTFDAPTNCALSLESVMEYRASTLALLELVSEREDVDVLHVFDFLCDDHSCTTLIDGIPLYRDAGHLSVDGSVIIGERTELARDILTRAR